MIATAEDVGVFMRALNNGTLLSDSEQAIYNSVYPSSHTGFLPGYQTIARYEPSTDTIVVLFGNKSDGAKWSDIEVLYDRLIKIIEKETSNY
jgi:hypothetical protein